MKLKGFTLFFACLLPWFVSATEITVTGFVGFGQDNQGAANYPVFIEYGTLADSAFLTVLTDDSGHYEATIDINPITQVVVSVLDFCTGVYLAQPVPTPNGGYNADFQICTDILPPPPPDGCNAFFYFSQTSVDPFTVQFNDLSYAADSAQIQWAWDFGDGSTSTDPNPQHDYAQAGAYAVTLTISTDSCTSSTTVEIIVTDDLGCICPDIYDPVCVYSATGAVITFSNSCEAECAGFGPDAYVSCNPNGGDCIVNFTFSILDQNPIGGFLVQFADSSFVNNGQILHWEWHFGDGQSSTQQNPQHGYPHPGVYLVTLTIISSNGCTATLTQLITIGDDCICPAIYDPVCVQTAAGVVFTFSNACEAECAGFDADDFVNCNTIDDCICPEYYNPVCVVTANGDLQTFDNPCFAACAGYNPTDFVPCNPVDSCFCPAIYDPVCVTLDSITTLEFTNACFAACAGYGPDMITSCQDTSGCNCPTFYDPVCFVTANGNIITFDNICIALCHGFGPDQYIDCNPSQFDCEASFSFGSDNPAGGGLTLAFVDYSTAQNATIVSWQWTFGDGHGSTQQNPIHTYAAEGVYVVTLNITTSSGCTSSVTQHICIGGGGTYNGPDCQAVFFFVQSTDIPGTFSFVDLSIGNITHWEWNFGDGTTSTEQLPTHTYAQPGVYLVTLTVSSADCSSTTTVLLTTGQDILYNQECTALFVPFLESDSLFAFFLNLSSPDAVSYLWDFGDGQTSTDFITYHVYSQPGVYTVSLTITNANGCTNTYSATIDFDNNQFVGNPAYLVVNGTRDLISEQSIQVAPNPTGGLSTLRFEAAATTPYQLSIFNTDGQLLLTKNAFSSAGVNNQLLDLTNLPSGLYFLKLQTDKEVHTLRVVKQ